MRVTMVLPFAAKQGPSSAAFYDSQTHKEVQLELNDGKHVFIEKDQNAREAMIVELVKQGFVLLGAEETSEEKKEPLKVEHRLMHPDGTPGNLINAEIEIKVGRRKETVQIVNSYVFTKDEKVAATLVEMGYVLQNPHDIEAAKESDK